MLAPFHRSLQLVVPAEKQHWPLFGLGPRKITRQSFVSFKSHIGSFRRETKFLARCLGLAVLKLRDGWVLFEREKLLQRSYNQPAEIL